MLRFRIHKAIAVTVLFNFHNVSTSLLPLDCNFASMLHEAFEACDIKRRDQDALQLNDFFSFFFQSGIFFSAEPNKFHAHSINDTCIFPHANVHRETSILHQRGYGKQYCKLLEEMQLACTNALHHFTPFSFTYIPNPFAFQFF